MNNALFSTHLRSSFRRWFTTAVTDWSIPRPRDDLLLSPVLRDPVAAPHSPRRPAKDFIRQGEWLFLPAPEVNEPLVIHWCAPLLRPGGGVSSIVAELARGHRGDPLGLFARGAVRHPDEATVYLDGWHRVTLGPLTAAPA